MEIIKQLKLKFILAIALIEMCVIAAIIFSLECAFTKHIYNDGVNFLMLLSENNGHKPNQKKPTGHTIYNAYSAHSDIIKHNMYDFLSNAVTSFIYPDKADAMPEFAEQNKPLPYDNQKIEFEPRNYFAANVSYSGVINEIIQDFPLNFTREEISDIILKIKETKKQVGTLNSMMYYVTPAQYGNYLVCILNRAPEHEMLRKLYLYSAFLYVLCIIFSVLIAIPLSRKLIAPIENAFNRQKQFVADAGHELKTPIAVISANIDVLEAKLKGNKWLGYIKSESNRMSELIKEMLYLAKNDAEKEEKHFQEFDFIKSVKTVILPFEVIAFEHGISLEFEMAPEIPCYGNEKSLQHIFTILTDNAIKNSERGGTITIKARAENQKIIFQVRNTGIGIKKSELDKIFLRFYRSDSSRARKTGGYGLGLSIARSIAESHSGTLSAASEFGKWAEFTLTLPQKKRKPHHKKNGSIRTHSAMLQ